jgi:phosphatidylglycerol:prolipoprotein diacylglycerol transferase
MHPILLEIDRFDLVLRSYPTFILLAVITCLWVGPRMAARLEGLDPARVLRALLWIGVAVFAGARLHFVLTHWAMFSSRPLATLKVWSGGIHAGGAIVALGISAPFILRRFAIPIGKFADGFAPTVGIGIAIARVGCFLQGCCFGTVCTVPWGIRFSRDTYIYQFHRELGMLPPDAIRSAPIHPLQLYFAAAGLLLTAIALWLQPRKRYDGQVGLVVLLTYSVGSAALELLRADYYPRVYWGPLPQLEWIALALTAASAALLLVAEFRHRATTGR